MLQIKEELESINGGDGRIIMWFLPLCSYHPVASSKGVVSPGISLIFRSWVLKIKNRPGKKPGQIHLGLFPQFWTNSGKGKSRKEATNILTKQEANANFFSSLNFWLALLQRNKLKSQPCLLSRPLYTTRMLYCPQEHGTEQMKNNNIKNNVTEGKVPGLFGPQYPCDS